MRRIATVLLATLLAAASFSVNAGEAYPSRPIRLIVPFPPGGGTDIMGRMVGNYLHEKMGVTTVVDNRGGAAGIIGTDAVAKSAPDGYTLLLGSVSTISMNPSLYAKLPYDTLKDLAPVALFASSPSVIVVPIKLPAQSFKELIALAKAKPGVLNFASAGSGTASHLGSELLKLAAGLDIVHVPYKGTGPVMTDLIAGQVSMFQSPIPPALPMIKAGQLRPLAVTSLTRSVLMPDVPTVAESGINDFEVIVWFGILAPGGTPPAIVERLNKELSEMTKLPEVRERLAAQGAEPLVSTPEAFGRKIRDDIQKWGKVVQSAGIKPS